MTLAEHALVALAWGSFGLVHSLLARAEWGPGLALRRACGQAYRLVYNVIAGLHVGAVWWLGEIAFAPESFDRPGWLSGVQIAAFVAGLAVLALAMRSYDGTRLLGLAQLRDPARDDATEPLSTGGLNAWVRHPIYTGAILLLWGRVDGEGSLATAIWLTVYIGIGAKMEERALTRRFGDAYRAYAARTPFLIPRPGALFALVKPDGKSR